MDFMNTFVYTKGEGDVQFKTLCTTVSRYMQVLYLNLYIICIYRHTMVHNL
jgi:hypothetical protein